MRTRTAATAAVFVCGIGMAQAALSPAEYAACVRDVTAMTTLQQQLSTEGHRLESASAALKETEHQLEAQQAQIATAKEQQARLYTATQVTSEHQAAPAKELDKILRATREFRKARTAFDQLVLDYNAKVRTQEERRDTYNKTAIELNARLADYTARAHTVDSRCEN